MAASVKPGICVLLGSGETTSVGRQVLSAVLQQLDEPRRVAVLDTPAGFQPNRRQVAERLVEFLTEKLAQWHPRPTLVETRREADPTKADAATLSTLAQARCIVAGPGSPTYMIRELAGTAYLEAIRQACASGTALYAASAAAIAFSRYSLPVYEIYKVGEDIHWKDGLDFFGPFGLSLAIVPHWNNREGGATLDTRFCYMGQERFERLRVQLPADVVILGLDEHTACTLNFATGQASVEGKGGVHLVRNGQFLEWSSGEAFPIRLLDAREPLPQAGEEAGLARPIEMLLPPVSPFDSLVEEEEETAIEKVPPPLIEAILSVRAELRKAGHWQWSDQLRNALTASGILVEDTAAGPRWHVAEDE